MSKVRFAVIPWIESKKWVYGLSLWVETIDLVNGEEGKGQKIGLQSFYGLSLWIVCMDWDYGSSLSIESIDWIYGEEGEGQKIQ